MLAGDSGAVVALTRLVLNGGFGVHAGTAARVNHGFQRHLVFVPIGVEHAGNTRHAEDVGIRHDDLGTVAYQVGCAANVVILAERVVVIDKSDGVALVVVEHGRGGITQQFRVVAGANTLIHHLILGRKIEHIGVVVCIAEHANLFVDVAIEDLCHREGCVGCFVVVVQVRAVDTLGKVVTPSVVTDLLVHPCQISTAHLTHLFQAVCPVA